MTYATFGHSIISIQRLQNLMFNKAAMWRLSSRQKSNLLFSRAPRHRREPRSPFAPLETPLRGAPTQQRRRKSVRGARRTLRGSAKNLLGTPFRAAARAARRARPSRRAFRVPRRPREALVRANRRRSRRDRSAKTGIPRSPETRPREFAPLTALSTIPGGCGAHHYL